MYEILGLIDRFGLIIVFVGTFFEGEVFAIIGGFLAYKGSHSLQLMMSLAFIGSFLGDLAVFLFARYFSNHRWVRRWIRKPKFAKALRLVDRFHAYFVIVNRYVYGLRMPGLIALGLSSITVPRFLILNFIGAGLWACIFTSIGYVFGYSISSVFARLETVEHVVLYVLIALAVALALYLGWRQFGPMWTKSRKENEPVARVGHVGPLSDEEKTVQK